MGCFNTRGFLSHTTILSGDEIVAFVCKVDKHCGRYFYYPLESYVPIMLPVYGRYNDYGNIEDIVDDDNYKWIKEHIGAMEDIVECGRDCMDRLGGGTIRASIDSDNPYHPKKKSRYTFENLLKHGMKEDDGIAILYEHKEIYETWGYKVKSSYDDDWYSLEKGFAEFDERADAFAEIRKNLVGKSDEESLKKIAMLFEHDGYNMMRILEQRFGNASYGILRVQCGDIDFLKRNMSELHKLQDFCWFMMSESLPMRPQCCGDTQNTSYKQDIAICKRTLEFLEKKQAEYVERYGEWDDEEDDE